MLLKAIFMFGIKTKALFAIALSVLFLGTAFGGYLRCMQNCAEMTFLSNAATGTVLMFSGVYALVRKRDVPHFLYLDCATLMTCVMFVCAVFAPEVCFVGASVLPHLVTPVAMLAFYFIFCDGRTCKTELIFTTVPFPTAYYIFMIVFGRVSGRSVYPYFDSNAMSYLSLVLIGVSAVALLAVLALVLLFINRRLHAAIAKRAAAKTGSA